MKHTLAALLFTFSLSTFAQTVFLNPTLINFGNSVQVQIHNYTDDNVQCSGSVYFNTQLNRYESHYYFDYISKKSFSMRSFYLSNFNDRILFANHSIFCNKVP